MGELRYQPVVRRSRDELEKTFGSPQDSQALHDALISAAYWDEDWKWIQSKCLGFADHPDSTVRAGVAYALGLLAVFHARLDMDIVVPDAGETPQ